MADNTVYPLSGFPNYGITKSGKIWTYKQNKWLHTWYCNNRYIAVYLRKNKIRYKQVIHTLVLETFIGKRPNDMECKHIDGNTANNCLDNLVWDKKHRTLEGFRPGNRGENNGMHKLTESEVHEMRLLAKCGYSALRLSNMYNVTRPYIYTVIYRKYWKHI